MAKLKALGYEHFMKCFQPAWDIAFAKEHNMAGWRIEGVIPFTRHALWKKVEEDEVIPPVLNSFACRGRSPRLQHRVSNSGRDADNTSMYASTMPPLPLRIQRFPEAVIIAIDYLQSCPPAASGILDMEAIMMQNLRLYEVAKAIGVWMGTITIEEDNETNMAKRISSRHVFDKAGSATRDEALAMLKAEEERKKKGNPLQNGPLKGIGSSVGM